MPSPSATSKILPSRESRSQPRALRDVKRTDPAGKAKVEQEKQKRQGVLFAVPAPVAPTAAAAVVRKSRKLSATTAQLAAEARWHPDVQPQSSRWWLADSPFLTVALAGSVLLHLVVLSIHFRPEIERMLDSGPALTVALVNAKSKDKPAEAEILAQANLDGGGNTDEKRRAKTPLPVITEDNSIRTELAAAPQQVEALERRTQELMTQLKGIPMPAPAPQLSDAQEPSPLPSATELTQRTLEAMRLEAEVAKEFDAYQKRPKRRFVGARAEEYRFARYVEDWRLKVERIGNLNYPEAARQMKLYGSLLLSVAIRADGSLENVEVARSSGHRVLDAAAVKIVQMGAPYAPLPADIRRDTDVLVITRTWSFTRGEELRTD